MTELVRVPPCNLDAESAILGIILIDNSKFHLISGMINESDFYNSNLRKIYSIIKIMINDNRPCDLLTLKDELLNNGLLDQVGGISAITRLLDDISSPVNVEYYAQIIRDKSMLRKVIQVGNTMTTKGYEAKEDPISIIEDVENSIEEIIGAELSREAEKMGEVDRDFMEKMMDQYENPESYGNLYTGFRNFDTIVGGLRKQDLIIIAGRPSTGKTSFALTITKHVAFKGKKVLFLSLEQSIDAIKNRLLSMETEADLRIFKTGSNDKIILNKIIIASYEYSKRDLFISDNPMSIDQICSIAKRYKLVHDIDLLVIDYLGLIDVNDMENRNAEVAKMSRKIKGLAKKLDIPIILLSQLNRLVETRSLKKPQLSDLRDSGALEQDADVVVLLWSEAIDVESGGYATCVDGIPVKVIIAKNRDGTTGVVDMKFQRSCVLYKE
ncbi:replicative DNA helicase [bacterium]|nr:replicative DNA helicase [bacterium]